MGPQKEIDIYDALLLLGDKAEAQAFLKDLCTPQELKALGERWRVCQLLNQTHMSYRDIHTQTGASLTTIGRVARFLKDEPYQGYLCILNRIQGTNT